MLLSVLCVVFVLRGKNDTHRIKLRGRRTPYEYYTIPESNGGPLDPRRPPYFILAGRAYQRLLELERRCCWKQSEQYTGLSPRGTKGTWASLPHDAQVVVCISREPPLL